MEYENQGPFFRGTIYSSSRSASRSPEPSILESSKQRSSSLDRITVTVYPSSVVKSDLESDQRFQSSTGIEDFTLEYKEKSPELGRTDELPAEPISPTSFEEEVPQTEDTTIDRQQSTESTEVVQQACQQVQSDATTEVAEMPNPESIEANHITEEDEQLFSELMKADASTHNGSSYHSTDTSELKVCPNANYSTESEGCEEYGSQSNGLEPPAGSPLSDEDETPKASPCMVRRSDVDRMVQTSPLSDNTDLEDSKNPNESSPPVSPRHTGSTVPVLSSSSSAEDLAHVVEPPLEFQGHVQGDTAGHESPLHPSVPALAVNGNEPTSKALQDKHLLKVKSSAIVRRHSYNDHFSRRFSNRSGSSSTSNSPTASPMAHVKSGNRSPRRAPAPRDVQDKGSPDTKVTLRRHSSIGHDGDIRSRPISIVGLVSTTRNDLSLEDLMSIPHDDELSPPVKCSEENMPTATSGQPRQRGLSASSDADASPTASDRKQQENGSPRRFRMARHKKAKSPLASAQPEGSPMSDHETSPLSPEPGTPVEQPLEHISSPVTPMPYEANPDESVTFDEILAGFDQYASATGKTTRSRDKYQKASPDPGQVKRKKSRWRRKTVATVDADTMKDVRAYMSDDKEEGYRAPSKVQQLARHYSRLIKEHQQSRSLRRYSTVVEESPETLAKAEASGQAEGSSEPQWLRALKDSRSRGESSDEGSVPIVTPRGTDTMPQLMDSKEERKLVTRTKSFTLPRVNSENAQANAPVQLLGVTRRTSLTSDDEELVDLQRRGRFKGWVRSLVERFSGSSKDK